MSKRQRVTDADLITQIKKIPPPPCPEEDKMADSDIDNEEDFEIWIESDSDYDTSSTIDLESSDASWEEIC